MRYFTITNKNESYGNSGKFMDGLNICSDFCEKPNSPKDGPYDHFPRQQPPIGFRVTTLLNISSLFGMGIYLHEVTLPMDDPDLKIIKDNDEELWTVNKMILGERYYLLDPEIIQLFNLPIVPYYIDTLCEIGDIKTLDKWKSSDFLLKYSMDALDFASKNGNCDVLDWWKNSGLTPVKYSERAIDFASEEGHVTILDWWKNSGYHLRYSVCALDGAFYHGKTETIMWWMGSGLKLKSTVKDITKYVKNSQNIVLHELYHDMFGETQETVKQFTFRLDNGCFDATHDNLILEVTFVKKQKARIIKKWINANGEKHYFDYSNNAITLEMVKIDMELTFMAYSAEEQLKNNYDYLADVKTSYIKLLYGNSTHTTDHKMMELHTHGDFFRTAGYTTQCCMVESHKHVPIHPDNMTLSLEIDKNNVDTLLHCYHR